MFRLRASYPTSVHYGMCNIDICQFFIIWYQKRKFNWIKERNGRANKLLCYNRTAMVSDINWNNFSEREIERERERESEMQKRESHKYYWTLTPAKDNPIVFAQETAMKKKITQQKKIELLNKIFSAGFVPSSRPTSKRTIHEWGGMVQKQKRWFMVSTSDRLYHGAIPIIEISFLCICDASFFYSLFDKWLGV
jgi:hypothetical protein